MQNVRANLFTREDTMLGICQGLGEDLGFHPNILRAALPVPLFFFPAETVAGYLAAGVIVLASRLLYPAPRLPAAEAVAATETEKSQAEQEAMALAA